jgi:hypothetical protein
MFMRDYDPSQIISDAELDQLVKRKLDTWHAGAWEGKKGLPPLPPLKPPQQPCTPAAAGA